MSLAIDTATKVHSRQIDAATRSQDMALKSLKKLSSAQKAVLGKLPQAPRAVTGSIAAVTQPVANIVGTPADHRAYVAWSLREWITLREQFQSALIDLVAARAVKVTPAKKASAVRA